MKFKQQINFKCTSFNAEKLTKKVLNNVLLPKVKDITVRVLNGTDLE